MEPIIGGAVLALYVCALVWAIGRVVTLVRRVRRERGRERTRGRHHRQAT